jgi:hypothetical protein
MGETAMILPGTGRWQSGGLTVGAHGRRAATRLGPLNRYAVPLPVPGRN